MHIGKYTIEFSPLTSEDDDDIWNDDNGFTIKMNRSWF